MALPSNLAPVYVGEPLPAALNESRTAINTLTGEVSGKITAPSGAQTGDLLRWDGTQWKTTQTRFLEGTGKPEGVVAGPIGSRYMDMNGTNGAVEWVKRTGTGNTGWLCVSGDTGYRNIAALFTKPAGSAVPTALLRRVGPVVDLYIDLITPTSAPEPWVPYILPVGFRPPVVRHGGLQGAYGGAVSATYINSNGEVAFRQAGNKVTDRFSGTWTTQEAWPTSLPGT